MMRYNKESSHCKKACGEAKNEKYKQWALPEGARRLFHGRYLLDAIFVISIAGFLLRCNRPSIFMRPPDLLQ